MEPCLAHDPLPALASFPPSGFVSSRACFQNVSLHFAVQKWAPQFASENDQKTAFFAVRELIFNNYNKRLNMEA